MYIVGIDISKADVHASLIENRQGAEPQEPQKFSQTRSGWKKLLKHIPDPAEAVVVFESTGVYSRPLARLLEGQVSMICEVNPCIIRNFGCSMNRIKSDRVDAKALARIGGLLLRERRELLERHKVDVRPARVELELLLNEYSRLSRAHRQLACALEPLGWHDHRVAEEAKKRIREDLKRLSARRKQLKKAIVDAAKRLDRRKYDLLVSIPGIGELTAPALVEAIVDIKRFASARALKAFFGLHPTLRQSGKYVGLVRMSSQGNDLVRALMWNCAKSAARHNPACHALYERGLARGRHAARMWGAIASKLMCQVYGVLHSDTMFDRERGVKAAAPSKSAG